MKLKVMLFTLMLAAPALAQGKPTLIDYPLDVRTPVPEAEQAGLQSEYRMLLAQSRGVMLSTKSHWKAAVAALKRADCDVRDECLQQLATTAGTLYAIYASVEKNAAGSEVTATGRVVNQDRLQVRSRLTFTVPMKKGFKDAAREALGRLLVALELEKLPATLSAAPPPLAADLPHEPANDLVLVVPALSPEVKESAPAAADEPLRIGGWVTGVLGVATAGLAAGFAVSAAVGRSALPADGMLRDERQARAQAAVNRDATISLISSLGAAALLGTATVLFIAAAPRKVPVVSLAPLPGGAHLTLTGEFSP